MSEPNEPWPATTGFVPPPAKSDEVKSTDQLFHTLWTKAVGTPGYEKAQWTEMERRLNLTTMLAALKEANVLGWEGQKPTPLILVRQLIQQRDAAWRSQESCAKFNCELLNDRAKLHNTNVDLRNEIKALRELVKKAASDSTVTTSDNPGCFYCDTAGDGHHAEDCPALAVLGDIL